MEFFIYYLLIYLLEAAAFGWYAAHVFPPKRSRRTRLFFLFGIYAALLLLFRLRVTWLNISGFFLGNLTFLLLCYDAAPSAALFHAGAATALMSACELIAYPFTLQGADAAQHFTKMLLWAFLSKPLYAGSLIFLSHAIHEEENRSGNTDSIIWSLICFPVVSSVILFVLYTIRVSYPISTEHEQMISAGAVLLLCMNLLVVYIYIHSRRRNHLFTQMQLSLQKEHDLSEYYQSMLKQDENQRILIHDIRNHLHTIALLNQQNETEQIEDYILRLTQSPALADNVRICDNKLLNLILYQYKQQCASQNIDLQLDIRSGVIDFMEENDITSLFCNLLDNAVESAESISGGHIELTVKKRASTPFRVITLINSCQTPPNCKDGRSFLSRKANPSRHGYGMKSVERVLGKYNGMMHAYFNPKEAAFHTVIMLGKQ